MYASQLFVEAEFILSVNTCKNVLKRIMNNAGENSDVYVFKTHS